MRTLWDLEKKPRDSGNPKTFFTTSQTERNLKTVNQKEKRVLKRIGKEVKEVELWALKCLLFILGSWWRKRSNALF